VPATVGQTPRMHDDVDPYRSAAEAAAVLRARLGEHRVAVVLGSGWSAVAPGLGRVVQELAATDLPGVSPPTVPGHEGTLRSVAVRLPSGRERPVLALSGRSHLYEGHDAAAVVHLVRAAVMSGCDTVVLTNAAGSLRPEVGTGSAVMISDQLNLTGTDPLSGPPPSMGPSSRFTDLTDLYDRELRAGLRARRPDLSEGVYAGLRGPSFETPAEIRMLRTMGADLVGMSTVLESIAARHLGARVAGISLVTNLAAGLQSAVDHHEVLAAGDAAAGTLVGVLADLVDVLDAG
jgi:purine-nucleoside phosphorylase